MTSTPQFRLDFDRFHYRLVEKSLLFPQLDAIKGRPDDATLDQLDRAAESMSRVIAGAAMMQLRHDLYAAKARLAQARHEFENVRELLADAVRRFVAARMPNRWLLALNVLVSIVAIGSDIGLTWLVLPTLMNVPARSPLGIALGCIPLIATVVLKGLFEWVFETIRHYREAPEGTWARRVAEGCDLTFHLGLLALNIGMLIKLGLGREEAARLLRALLDVMSDAPPTFDLALVGSLVVWVGVVGVLDGGFVIGGLMRQLHEMAERRRAIWDLGKLRPQNSRLHNELSHAEAYEACLREEWNEQEGRVRDLENALHSRARTTITEIRSRARSPRPALHDIVAEALAPERLTSFADRGGQHSGRVG